ncbi:hypothetical protein GGTG_13546 [Gaeumannomyces tritici R3-111a-1]|uniref:Vegetative cell wall protein gp1 n=1 Tax=Gaeumannomyces tritici (strain R3-111a-1) TaxID=644352 RepID=J3PJ64_GAET3|nr:hypothetical protein GGTG_13546 [Gaeumannomyces tritici R3-111a-1]EJT68882.1 hypothetical protein GGTG_13546 [Gaeumannomyces tritici R3-111a-1]
MLTAATMGEFLPSPRCTGGGLYSTIVYTPPCDFCGKWSVYEHLPKEPARQVRRRDSTSSRKKPAPQARRRHSTSRPRRSQHHRDSSKPQKSPRRDSTSETRPPEPKQPEHRAVTEEDARKHWIPDGYSLTHWDPTEQPILLLGSVFDANSLGKWIYDWTVYRHGRGRPISQMAGELWLLLIEFSGKIKGADEIIPSIRQKEVRKMVEDFIDSGDRLTDKLRKLLKRCEAPMLQSSQRRGSELGSNAGVEFVLTLFGRKRELPATEKFMASVRLWNLRFDTNCTEVLLNPGK